MTPCKLVGDFSVSELRESSCFRVCWNAGSRF